MYSIIDKVTGRLIIASCFSNCEENEIAIEASLTEPIPDGMTAYWNFETETFYFK